mmetsp:Transcript_22036/g.48099  ORF Transcript_22036/g.48099 Transcript_22036/m.48099 type:complete len:337 (+) Transcript_22036:1357-2367(+)
MCATSTPRGRQGVPPLPVPPPRSSPAPVGVMPVDMAAATASEMEAAAVEPVGAESPGCSRLSPNRELSLLPPPPAAAPLPPPCTCAAVREAICSSRQVSTAAGWRTSVPAPPGPRSLLMVAHSLSSCCMSTGSEEEEVSPRTSRSATAVARASRAARRGLMVSMAAVCSDRELGPPTGPLPVTSVATAAPPAAPPAAAGLLVSTTAAAAAALAAAAAAAASEQLALPRHTERHAHRGRSRHRATRQMRVLVLVVSRGEVGGAPVAVRPTAPRPARVGTDHSMACMTAALDAATAAMRRDGCRYCRRLVGRLVRCTWFVVEDPLAGLDAQPAAVHVL